MRLTSREIYNKLLNEDKILEIKGQIKFFLGDVNIVVKQKDVVGNIIQEWLQGWLDKNSIEYAPSKNTQMPPDFFLNPDFRMYEEEIIDKPYMLDVDYLIFGYDMDENGHVVIKDIWLKKVWEITRRMKDWPINLQVKSNVVHKIRPGVWYSEKNSFPMFEKLEDFISAVEHTVWQNPKTREESAMWKLKFLKSYENYYGIKLKIPRWDEIEEYYSKKSDK